MQAGSSSSDSAKIDRHEGATAGSSSSVFFAAPLWDEPLAYCHLGANGKGNAAETLLTSSKRKQDSHKKAQKKSNPSACSYDETIVAPLP
jgi:hypothetical protein